LHEQGYTFSGENTLYELTARELNTLITGYNALKREEKAETESQTDGLQSDTSDYKKAQDASRDELLQDINNEVQ